MRDSGERFIDNLMLTALGMAFFACIGEIFGNKDKKPKIVSKKVVKNPVRKNVPRDDSYLFYDLQSGRYFRMRPKDFDAAEKELNWRLRTNHNVLVNEYYILMGLEPTIEGNDLCWDTKAGHEKIKLNILTYFDHPDEICLVVQFDPWQSRPRLWPSPNEY